MSDLSDLFRPLVDAVAPGPSIEDLTRRVARRRHRKRVGGFAGGAVAVAVIAAGVGVAVHSGGRAGKVIVGTSPSSGGAPAHTTLPDLAPPPSEQRISYGDATVLIPATWTYQSAQACDGGRLAGSGPVWAGYAPPGACVTAAAHLPSRFVSLGPTTDDAQPGPQSPVATSFNGHQAAVTGCVNATRCETGSTTFFFADLGVSLTVDPGDAQTIARSIGYSAEHLVIGAQSGPVAVPANWSTITYDGLRVRAPSAWPLEQFGTTAVPPNACGQSVSFTTPVVDEGPGTTDPPCLSVTASTGPPARAVDGIWIHPASAARPGETVLRSSPARVLLAPATPPGPGQPSSNYNAPGYPVLVLIALNGQGKRVELDVGLGNDPAVAAAIIASITPVTRS